MGGWLEWGEVLLLFSALYSEMTAITILIFCYDIASEEF